MAGKLVLLTGATGFIGFATLRSLLKHDYTVRAAVRSEAKAEAVRSNPVLKDVKPGQLSFVVIPDFAVDGAFDEAVKDCEYVVHVASPLADKKWTGDDDLEALMVKPAVGATLGLLQSAKKAGTVKRISVTSSIAAVVPASVLAGGEATEPFSPDARNAELSPPYMNIVLVGYMASKVAALNRAEAWVAKEKPGFDVIHLHPSFVLGRDDLSRSVADFEKSTNYMILDPLLGRKADPISCAVVHVDDVALAHVRSLDAGVKGNQSFLLTNDGTVGEQWDDAIDFVKKHFPQAVEDGTLPCNGSVASAKFRADTTRIEQLGMKFQSFEDMVVSGIGQYLELLRKEKPSS